MKISARNVFKGKVIAINHGMINAEVVLSLPGGDEIAAIVTESSIKALELDIGQEATGYVKAPWVVLMTEAGNFRFSARNQLTGTVNSLVKGAVNSEVGVQLPGGSVVYAVVTNEAVIELGLKVGVTATALFKASHIILGVGG